jgi:hypothetical protein
MPPSDLTNSLKLIDYVPPTHPAEVNLDIVTPTCNRGKLLEAQAQLLGPQLTARDRWVIVDDASDPMKGCDWRNEVVPHVPSPDCLLIVSLTYVKHGKHHVNRARSIGVDQARMNSWVVEIDDHDLIEPGALHHVREAICRGAIFIYGDAMVMAEGDPSRRLQNQKPDYEPWTFRDTANVAEGMRAYPAWLYHVVGGYRWRGPIGLNGNEFPGGDYCLFLRMELFCGGRGFYRIPGPLCTILRASDSIGLQCSSGQVQIAQAAAAAAKCPESELLTMGPTGRPETDSAWVNSMMRIENE